MQSATNLVPDEVTLLLRRVASGDRATLERLMDVIYPELRRIARATFRTESHERVLQPTALVNEAYLRLLRHKDHNWRDRAHFFAAAAQLMRRILIESARRRLAGKRSAEIVNIEAALEASSSARVDLLRLDEALVELAEISPRQASIVEMRFFAGLTVPEVAAALSLTSRTVDRDWALARAWLRRRLS